MRKKAIMSCTFALSTMITCTLAASSHSPINTHKSSSGKGVKRKIPFPNSVKQPSLSHADREIAELVFQLCQEERRGDRARRKNKIYSETIKQLRARVEGAEADLRAAQEREEIAYNEYAKLEMSETILKRENKRLKAQIKQRQPNQ